MNKTTNGKIIQIIGAVVDVEFAHDDIPRIYDALVVTEKNLVLEVQQLQTLGLAVVVRVDQQLALLLVLVLRLAALI